MQYEDINTQALRQMHGFGFWLSVAKSLLFSRLIALPILTFFSFSYLPEQISAIISLVYFVVVVVVVFGIRDKLWGDFAKVNKWKLLKARSKKDYIPPSLFMKVAYDSTPTRIVGDSIDCVFGVNTCEVYQYSYTATFVDLWGKSRDYVVARIATTNKLPSMILDSKKTEAVEEFSIPVNFVSLEGDFDEYFSLYCRKDDQINALSIITPDVMQALIQVAPLVDIEISDNYIYLITRGNIAVSTVKKALKAVDIVASEFSHQASHHRSGDMTAKQLRVSTKPNIIPKSIHQMRTRLNYKARGLLLILAIPAAIYLLILAYYLVVDWFVFYIL